MSLQEIQDLLSRLVRERADDVTAGRPFMPEPIALLTIAWRAIDAAIAGRSGREIYPGSHEIYRQLAAVSRGIIVRRDQLDEAMHAPRMHAGIDSAAKAAAAKRTSKASPLDLYAIGDVVDVLGNNTSRVESVGRVIKKNTRLYIESLDPEAAARGHMAHDAGFVRARVRKHEHRFGMMDPGPKPHSDVEVCNGCERSARELGIKVTP